jgi:hypothetical protein
MNTPLTLSSLNIVTAAETLNRLMAELIGMDPQLRVRRGDDDRQGPTVEVTSIDLAAAMTPKMFKHLHVATFGRPTVVEDGTVCFPMNFSYEHLRPGSNGCEIATVWLNMDGTLQAYRAANGDHYTAPGVVVQG